MLLYGLCSLGPCCGVPTSWLLGLVSGLRGLAPGLRCLSRFCAFCPLPPVAVLTRLDTGILSAPGSVGGAVPFDSAGSLGSTVVLSLQGSGIPSASGTFFVAGSFVVAGSLGNVELLGSVVLLPLLGSEVPSALCSLFSAGLFFSGVSLGSTGFFFSAGSFSGAVMLPLLGSGVPRFLEITGSLVSLLLNTIVCLVAKLQDTCPTPVLCFSDSKLPNSTNCGSACGLIDLNDGGRGRRVRVWWRDVRCFPLYCRMREIFSRCFLSCRVLNLGNLLLPLLDFCKGQLLLLTGFFLLISVSLGCVCLGFTFVVLSVGFAAGLFAAVEFFGAMGADPLFGFDVSFLLVAGGVVAWASRGL